LSKSFRVEPDRDARCGAPGPPRPLLRGRLGDRLDRQLLDLRAGAVAGDARRAGVDHVADARNGEARLRDVRREDHAPSYSCDIRALEDPVLFRCAQAAVQGEHLRGCRILRIHSAHGIRRIADLGLARQEHEHVARSLAVELSEGGGDAVDVVGRGLFRTAVADLDGVRPPGHLDDRRGIAVGIREVLREALRIDRCARDDHAQIRALRQHLREVADQEVDVERALVRFVDDDRVVLLQQTIAVDLVEQDAVGHEGDARVLLHLVGEADLVPDRRAQRHFELLGDALRDRPRRDAPRLGVRDAGASELEADLRELRRLARPGGARDDHDLVVADRARDLVPRGADGQLRRVREDGFARGHSLRSYRAAPARVAKARSVTGTPRRWMPRPGVSRDVPGFRHGRPRIATDPR